MRLMFRMQISHRGREIVLFFLSQRLRNCECYYFIILQLDDIDHQVNKLIEQWPNLKNLSGGLNLSRGLNMVGST